MTGGRIAITIPCYNEASRLDTESFRRFMAGHTETSFCFVNDGSTDNTSGVLKGLVDAAPDRACLVEMRANTGKAEAVRAGMLHIMENGAYEYLGYWDADLATPLDTIPGFAHALDGSPGLLMASGSRIRRLGSDIARSPMRHYTGRLFATAASIALALPVYDTQCGAKLLRKEAAESVFREPFSSRWVFDVEVFARICAHAGRDRCAERILEIPLDSWRDVPGSKLRLVHALGAATDLLRIALRYRAR